MFNMSKTRTNIAGLNIKEFTINKNFLTILYIY
jgi:hypothetical protein